MGGADHVSQFEGASQIALREAVPFLPLRYTRDEIRFGNRLAVRRRAFVADTPLGEMEIIPRHPTSINLEGVPVVGIYGDIDGSSMTLWAPAGAMSAIVTTAEPGSGLRDLTPPTRALVIEDIFSVLLDKIEARGARIILHEIGDPVRSPDGEIGLLVRIGQIPPFSALLRTNGGLGQRVAAWAEALPYEPRAMPNLPVIVAFRAGITWLPAASVRELRPGDAIMFDTSRLGDRRLPAVIGESFVRICEIDTRGLVLTADPPLRTGKERAIWMMENHMSDGRTSAPDPEVGSVDSLDVKLVFELGRLTMSVGEIERLDAGYVFDLGRQPGQAVDIFAMNKLIGQGELVMVSDQLGVRVTRIIR